MRAFNERSWLCYTDRTACLGWRDACFDLVRNEMMLSPLGKELRAAGTPDEQIFRTPRAVDSMHAVLRKRALEAGGEAQAEDRYDRAGEHLRGAVAASGRERPRICLSMIVKNEAHVIERCLRSVLPYIDGWAICDTGSTDGTQERIRSLLANLPGELLEQPWVDFAHNRNEALQLAHRYGDYALVIDADDVFEAEPGFQWGALGATGYLFEIVFGDDQAFWRVALMRLGLDWVWEGVIHEVPVCSQLGEVMQTKLRGPRIRIVGGGARSRQSLQEKYLKDVEVLQRALVDLPDNPRYTFYLAQGLNESGQLREALATYERRVEIGGWFEEVYYSKLQIASLEGAHRRKSRRGRRGLSRRLRISPAAGGVAVRAGALPAHEGTLRGGLFVRPHRLLDPAAGGSGHRGHRRLSLARATNSRSPASSSPTT